MFDLFTSNLGLLALAGFSVAMVILLLWDEHIEPWRSEKRRRRTCARSSSPALDGAQIKNERKRLRKSDVDRMLNGV